MSQLKVDNITDELGTGAPNFPNGIANGFLQKGAPIIFTTSGTYTPNAGTRAIRVQVQGGGAGGGSVSGSGSQAAVGGGGGAGGFTEKFITPLEASYTVAIGAGGSGGGDAGAENGSNGGQSSFVGASVNMVADGGQGGTGRNSAIVPLQAPGGIGGTASGGDLNVRGGRGTRGGMIGGGASSTFTPCALGHPDGANSFFGSGGAGPAPSGSADSRNSGNAGQGFGSGGSGAAVINASVTRSGGGGRPGLIIITEYE